MSSTATSPPPPMSHRRKKPRHDRGVAGNGKKFGCLKPVDNPHAVRSYYTSLVGLVPLAGAVCGPLAVCLAAAGLLRRARKPDSGGGNFAAAGLILGGLEVLTHAVGLNLIARGLGW